MSKIRKSFISVLAVLLCVAVSLAAVFLIDKNVVSAMVISSSNDVVYVGVEKDENGETKLADLDKFGAIDGDVLLDLLKKLGASSSGTINSALSVLKGLANTPADTGSQKWDIGYNAAEMRALNSNKNIIVKFGGLTWTVVYLSNDRNGDTVVTLWLSDTAQMGQSAAKFTGWTSDAAQYGSNYDYPEISYSTSLVRSKLNLGISYASGNANTARSLVEVKQDASHPLAPFTMTQSQLSGTGKYSVMQYIDMPYLIKYQETLSNNLQNGYMAADSGHDDTTFNMTNDAYGIPGSANTGTNHNARGYSTTSSSNFDFNSYTLNNYMASKIGGTTVSGGNNASIVKNMTTKDLEDMKLYNGDTETWKRTYEWTQDELNEKMTWVDSESWAFDTVWTPSVLEVGVTRPTSTNIVYHSLWKTDTRQRISDNAYWTRSGHPSEIYYGYRVLANGYTNQTGTYASSLTATTACARPAIHLNLNTCAQGVTGISKPKISNADGSDGTYKTVEYNGKDYTMYLDTLSTGLEVEITTSEGIEKSDYTFSSTSKSLKASKLGKYTIKFTPKTLPSPLPWKGTDYDTGFSTYIWSDTGGVAPYSVTFEIAKAKINVNFDTGTDQTLKQDRTYVYHKDVDYPLTLSTSLIGLNSTKGTTEGDADIASIKIKYKVIPYDDPSELNGLLSQSVPNEDWVDSDWDADITQVNGIRHYLVWFKITADNHKDYLGEEAYFVVHVVPATFKIEFINGLGSYTYGSLDQTNLYKLLYKSDGITPAYTSTCEEEPGYSGSDDIDWQSSEISIYVTEQGSSTPLAVNKLWDANKTYELHARWTNNQERTATFVWPDPAPTFKITPADATLTFIGKDGTENSDPDNFTWTYSGAEITAKAYFRELSSNEDVWVELTGRTAVGSDNVTVTEEVKKTYTNYNFVGSQKITITQATNGWKSEFGQITLTVCDKSLVGKDLATPYFGKATIEYYRDELLTQPLADFNAVQAAGKGTYWAKVYVDGNDNYTGIPFVQPYKFTVDDHDFYGSDWKSAGPDESDGHYQICKVSTCGQRSATSNHEFNSYKYLTPSYHTLVCYCGQESGREAHEYKFSNTVAESCLGPGYDVYACVCGDEEQRNETAQLPHALTHVGYHAATATADGNYEYWYCKMCGRYFGDEDCTKWSEDKEDTVIPAGSEPSQGGVFGTGGSGSGSGGGTTTPGGDDNNDPNGGGSTGGDEAGKDNTPATATFDMNQFLADNWWWLLILALVIIAVIIIMAVLRNRREKRLLEMILQSQQQQQQPNYPPIYNYPEQPEMLQVPQGNEQLQLPSGMSEEAMTRAFVAALHQYNGERVRETVVVESGDGFEDLEGFYDDISQDDIDNLFNK